KNPITHAQRAGHTTRKLWRGVCVYGVQCCRGGAEENEVANPRFEEQQTNLQPGREVCGLLGGQLCPERQQFKISRDKKARPVKDGDSLQSLGISDGGVIYLKDLGPQVGWSTVFLAEYAGPLAVYLLFYPRPALVYGTSRAGTDIAVHVAMVCWTLHYAKRLLETLFVHRFSHATMPLRNLFKNCSYYWGFTAFVSYYINHPLYTPPGLGSVQLFAGLALFLVCEYGNFSIHIALRDLRPPGTKERKIPMPTSNPMTKLFHFVSCPNYTYEVGAWLGFSLMTQCLPALLFAVAGFLQMAQWARGKHRNYRRDFPSYPQGRTAIVPFVI
ncbi:Probable very-long-chain enoyl-CoA reductase art-1, partial [Geodia barretti]